MSKIDSQPRLVKVKFSDIKVRQTFYEALYDAFFIKKDAGAADMVKPGKFTGKSLREDPKNVIFSDTDEVMIEKEK